MVSWAVTVLGTNVFFEATLLVQTEDAGTVQDAKDAAALIAGNLKVVRQLGPQSWDYDALMVGDARKLA